MDVTMAVKAEPMTTPTAMSSTLPRMMNVLNSSIQVGFFMVFSPLSLVWDGTIFRRELVRSPKRRGQSCGGI